MAMRINMDGSSGGQKAPHTGGGLASALLRETRELAFAGLSSLEPIVRFGLVAIGMLGLLTCLIQSGAPRAHFPQLKVLAISVGCFAVAGLYSVLLRVLKPR
jgi:hypothetical protein